MNKKELKKIGEYTFKNKEYTDAMLVKEHNHPADVTGVSVEKCTA